MGTAKIGLLERAVQSKVLSGRELTALLQSACQNLLSPFAIAIVITIHVYRAKVHFPLPLCNPDLWVALRTELSPYTQLV